MFDSSILNKWKQTNVIKMQVNLWSKRIGKTKRQQSIQMTFSARCRAGHVINLYFGNLDKNDKALK